VFSRFSVTKIAPFARRKGEKYLIFVAHRFETEIGIVPEPWLSNGKEREKPATFNPFAMGLSERRTLPAGKGAL
jgi:hypothetical protein